MLLTNDGVCDTCYGSGRIADFHTGAEPYTMCEECLGTGATLTEIGKELIAFLKLYYALTLKER